MGESFWFLVESPVSRIEGISECLVDATLGAKKLLKVSDMSVPLQAPCIIGTAVSTVSVATLVPSLIICMGFFRLRHDSDHHAS